MSTTASNSATTDTSPTSTSASSTTITSSPNGFFSPGGSPALVLAFLAIGIFAGGLISMIFLRRFALRHLFNRRGWQPEGESFDTRMDFAFGGGMHNRSRRRGPKLGPKPVLWDFQGVSLRNWKRSQDWNLVLPVSARVPEPPNAITPTQPQPAPPQRSGISTLLRLPRHPTPPQIPTPVRKSDGSIQLAVAVAMPFQRNEQPRRTEGDSSHEVPIYELGFVNLPWSSKNSDVLKALQPSEGAQSIIPVVV
ncbi:hypothetical protein PHLCEN_2v3953 [Hermanssonia centrifuga]|uniref:Uncharacterized protein n=1 Tax=Hermanssonia centrifuga TaxID=98765 RepID=A0A2R6Q7K1_9APHY|nr:hypothetical protein PHLCEN_2v3953 [Hermanssonia centrifuga]